MPSASAAPIARFRAYSYLPEKDSCYSASFKAKNLQDKGADGPHHRNGHDERKHEFDKEVHE